MSFIRYQKPTLKRNLSNNVDSLLYIGPRTETLETLIETIDDLTDPPTMQLLVSEGTLKTTLEEFFFASRLADLVADGIVSIRTVETPPVHEVIVTDDRVTALVSAGERMASLSTEDAEFVATANEIYTTAWEQADPYSLRTPPRTRVRETLRDELGPEVADDFDAMIDALGTTRGEDGTGTGSGGEAETGTGAEGLDEVAVSLLSAAKHEELLYDISRWGEDVGLASKATFSRTKTALEERGLIDTEKVPIDVGRPRLRLRLADERLRDASPTELAELARAAG